MVPSVCEVVGAIPNGSAVPLIHFWTPDCFTIPIQTAAALQRKDILRYTYTHLLMMTWEAKKHNWERKTSSIRLKWYQKFSNFTTQRGLLYYTYPYQSNAICPLIIIMFKTFSSSKGNAQKYETHVYCFRPKCADIRKWQTVIIYIWNT